MTNDLGAESEYGNCPKTMMVDSGVPRRNTCTRLIHFGLGSMRNRLTIYGSTSMKRLYITCFWLLLTLPFLQPSNANADTIFATDIANGSSSYTTSGGEVTLTPFAAGGGAGTFGAVDGGTQFFGVAGGANANAIDDADGDPLTTGDRESMGIQFDSLNYLSEITFIWTRANGDQPSDGIVISGFLSDPGATEDHAGGSVTWDSASGSVFFNYNWQGSTLGTISFANAGASLGQTLSISTNDSGASTEGAPQAAINQIGFNAVPEPSSMAIIGLTFVGFLASRKRRLA